MSYTEQFETRHKEGIVRLTGSNRGLLYANERQVEIEVPATDEGGQAQKKKVWEYDVYEVNDASQPHLAKCIAIETEHPYGDEQKLLRKTLAKVLKKLGDYDSANYAEFKQYDLFCEGIDAKSITGSIETADPTAEELLADAKATMIAKIEAYNSSANVNAFTVDGTPMWLDFELRSRLKNSVDAAEAEGRQELTKTFGGVSFTYTIALWKQMIVTVENYAGDCQTVTDQHIATVQAMRSIKKVNEFDYTADYPTNPAF